MNVWLTYFRERIRPGLSLPVILGISISCSVLGGNIFHPLSFFISSFLLFYLVFFFRLRNDVKDFEKDKIAYPKRPLPRKLMTLKSANKALRYLEYGLWFFFLLIFIIFWGQASFFLLITAGYLWLILHDFYQAKEWLQRRPLVKGIADHGFIFVLTLFIISLGRPELALSWQGLSYALITFSTLFTYDICRKLDPYSHPIALSYVHYYGFKKVLGIVMVLLLLSAWGASGLGLLPWLMPFEAVLFAALFFLLIWPKQYKFAENAAVVSVLVHVWAGPLQHLAKRMIWQ